MVEKIAVVIVLITIGLVTASSFETTINARQFVPIRLLSSGSLSYRVQSLNKGDYLCVLVAPQFCFVTDGCPYYPTLSTPRDSRGYCLTGDRLFLSPTNYTTGEEYLFLFISNMNAVTTSTVFYSYNNTDGLSHLSPTPTA